MRSTSVIVAVVTCGACGAPNGPNTPRGDDAAIRAHAWQLWATLASGDAPAWDEWAPTERVFAGADPTARPRFRVPRPFRNGDVLEHEALPVMFDVVFDPTAAAHVGAHGLGSRAELDTLRELPAFPRESIAAKLVWYPVHASGLTAMPIWDADPVNDDSAGNPDRSWRRAIAVDPTRTSVPDGETTDVMLEGRAFVAHVVPLAAFVYRELVTDEEIATARIASRDATLERGDHVALVAAHVTTKERPDWTWETYWWHDRPEDGAFAAGRPSTIRGAAASYVMDATVSTERPCFNPWLEARFPNGMQSNCVTCHQRAVVGATDYLPVTRGRLRADDPYFDGHVPTDFVWSIAFESR